MRQGPRSPAFNVGVSVSYPKSKCIISICSQHLNTQLTANLLQNLLDLVMRHFTSVHSLHNFAIVLRHLCFLRNLKTVIHPDHLSFEKGVIKNGVPHTP